MSSLLLQAMLAFAALLASALGGVRGTGGATARPVADSAAGSGTAAFAGAGRTVQPRRHTVVLDPGHGGDEIGAAGNGLLEKDSNLDIAGRVRAILEAQGVRVVLTRQTDSRAVAVPDGAAPGSFPLTRLDLQARVDLANSEHADLFLSLHSNGSVNPTERGVEVWYDAQRSFARQNEHVAQLVLGDVMDSLARAGYAAASRGLKEDSCWTVRMDRCFSLFVLGPARDMRGQPGVVTRPAEMPGVLAELLFISNQLDASWLRLDRARDAIAQGVANAVLTYLGELDAAQP